MNKGAPKDTIMNNITESYKVDQYENVYDDEGYFYCKWDLLTEEEQAVVRQNPASFY